MGKVLTWFSDTYLFVAGEGGVVAKHALSLLGLDFFSHSRMRTAVVCECVR